MAQFKVDVPDKLLDDTSRKRIKQLEGQLKNRDVKIKKLEKKLSEQKKLIKGAKELQLYISDWELNYSEDWFDEWN